MSNIMENPEFLDALHALKSVFLKLQPDFYLDTGSAKQEITDIIFAALEPQLSGKSSIVVLKSAEVPQTDNTNLHFNKLPAEIHGMILGRLRPRQLIRMRNVNRYFADFVTPQQIDEIYVRIKDSRRIKMLAAIEERANGFGTYTNHHGGDRKQTWHPGLHYCYECLGWKDYSVDFYPSQRIGDYDKGGSKAIKRRCKECIDETLGYKAGNSYVTPEKDD